VKTQYLDVPQGTKEYVVIVPTLMPEGVDASSLSAEMSVVARGEEPTVWSPGQWLSDPGGWGLIVDTTAMVGEYDVRVRFTYGAEVPMLGPVRLRVLVE
jgi:hypothetical protein